MLKSLKLGALRWAARARVSSFVLDSTWRKQRLLILCYHGTSLADEHEWRPSLYVTPSHLRARLELLRRQNCTVLALDDALRLLYTGELPARSVCLTFDDGAYDFYKVAHPIVREYGFPVTLYLTTYYSNYNRPVFDVMCSYLLWKGRGRWLEWPEVLSEPIALDAAGRLASERCLKAFAYNNKLSAREKDNLLASLADKLVVDYESLCAERILHLISPAEAKELAENGVDIQLHTHRHRSPLLREEFLREIDDNRRSIGAFSKGEARHFCYPSGFHVPQFRAWLKERAIVSATTCVAGLASRRTDPLLLPRLVDATTLSLVEFAGWVSGVAFFLPHRPMVLQQDPRFAQTAANVL